MGREMKGPSFFVTQKGKRRAHTDYVDADQLARTNQSTLLLKKKEMREVDDALEFMKDEYHARMDSCDHREVEFKQKQLGVREQVLKFEKFIHENDDKRARAEAKAKQERRLLEQKAVELRKLKKELAQAMEEEAKLTRQRQRLKRYEDYLKGCGSSTDSQGDEVNDLLNRFIVLRGANSDLTKLCEQHDTSYDRGRSEIQQYRRDKQNELLVKNSSLNEKQMELEQIRGGVKRAEHESEQESERVKGVCRESGQVMLAINNLHSRCKQTMRTRIPGTNDSKELDKMGFLERCLHCLHVIGDRIEDLREIQVGYASNLGHPNAATHSTTANMNSVASSSIHTIRNNHGQPRGTKGNVGSNNKGR